MKFNQNYLIVILSLVVVVGFIILKLYLSFFPLPTLNTNDLNLKEVETNIDLKTLETLKGATD